MSEEYGGCFKASRQINAVEMKVNIYRQQVYDLQVQLDKQRQLSHERFEQLERQFKAVIASVDTNSLIERRLNFLEKGFRQINIDMHPANIINSSPDFDKSTSSVFNSIDNSPLIAQNMVKFLIQSEVKEVFDNFTKRFETYVPEQILIYNKVFNMLPRRKDASTHSNNFEPSEIHTSTLADHTTVQTRPKGHQTNDEPLTERFEKLKAKLNNTGNQTAKPIDLHIKNKTSTDYVYIADNNHLIDHNVKRKYNQNSMTGSAEYLRENNESFSGDNVDSNDTNSDALTSTNNDISGSVSSRIRQKFDTDTNTSNLEHFSSDGKKIWKGRDEFYEKIAETEARLKDEITAMLYTPIAEVMSFVENRILALDDRIKHKEDIFEQINAELKTQIRELENSVRRTNLQLESLSMEVRGMLSKPDRITPLEEVVNEIRRNITTGHTTKFSKLERVMGVYQQSLEHYRNETKYEYREIRGLVEKDINTLRIFSSTLQNNVTSTINSEMNKLNKSYMSKFQEVNDHIRTNDETLVLLQIDIGNMEKILENKPKRSDRDIEDMQETINDIVVKQRDFKKKLEHIEESQSSMHENISNYVKDVLSLKTEVKLNLDEWLPLTFDFDSSRTDCFGEQYVKRIHYSKAKLVGVVLCSPTRYKIFLSASLQSKFWNIGDGTGMGEDHCEFVGGNADSQIKLSPFKPSFAIVQGFARNQWGQEPTVSYLNAIKPSPFWYECGVKIP